MGFDGRWCAGLLLIVVLWGNIAAGREGGRGSEITVLVNNSAGVSPPVLNQSEGEAARIFRAAGIDIVWVNCGGEAALADDACRRVLGSNEFMVHIVSKGKTSSDLVFGLAFLAEDGGGKYSDVFYDRVEQAHRRSGADVSSLVGTVAAHELGHLLLGSHAHSYEGIMAAVWNEETLRHMEMGGLLFTRDQASRMRGRIRRDRMTLVRVGASTEK
jgi:hypothetical protein